jgi:catechol 2,3-dioxygenase-like lactoylglutathione lyase family enzyme
LFGLSYFKKWLSTTKQLGTTSLYFESCQNRSIIFSPNQSDSKNLRMRSEITISGINHVTLAVRNLEESFQFYREVLGFKPLAKWTKGAYFLVGDLWFCAIEDDRINESFFNDYTHIAFTVSQEDFESICDRIKNSGAKIWQENTNEGASLYFTDPNNHKLEIHVSDLETRLKTIKEKPWDGLEVYV